jgi:glyoxylate carboligase
MRAMYERPWTARPSGPSIVTVTGATLRRAVHRDGGQAIEFDLVADAASAAPIVVGFGALTPGRTWQLMETGRSGRPSDGRTVRIPVDARGQATIASAIGAQRYRLEAIG